MRNPSKKLGIGLFLMASAVALVAFFDAGEADAFTCESVCSQIRRGCNAVARSTTKVAFIDCLADRDTCRGACEVDPGSCTLDCAATCAAICQGAADPVACEADCVAGCPTGCTGCCNLTGVACWATAKAVRRDAWLACRESRATCPEACSEVDSRCVRGCGSAYRSCARPFKRDETNCKRACPRGTGRRACVRGCRRDLHSSLLNVCLPAGISCLGGCITP